MPRYIISGCYTSEAMKGMIAHPSDREGATRALIEASGGKMESFLITTGDKDFSMVVTSDDQIAMMAALMTAGASGAVTGLKTVQAFTSAEFLKSQKQAAKMVQGYKPPN